MISRDEYLKALDVVEEYHRQIKREANKCDIISKGPFIKTPIADCELIQRTKNSLYSCEIGTVYELVQLTRAELSTFRSMGKKALMEIEEFLESHGLHLGMKINEQPFPITKT